MLLMLIPLVVVPSMALSPFMLSISTKMQRPSSPSVILSYAMEPEPQLQVWADFVTPDLEVPTTTELDVALPGQIPP